jgi:hypothetical protein
MVVCKWRQIMDIKDVIKFIITDASVSDSGMSAIITAVRERQKINRSQSRAIALATIRVGMTVRLSGLTPKYWDGTEGTVVSFNKTRTRATIKITKSSNQFKIKEGTTQQGFPISTLTPVEVKEFGASSITDTEADAFLDFMRG